MPRGHSSVSPWSTVTSSIGTPSCSAAICAHAVSCPCPCGEVPLRTVTAPSGSTVTPPGFPGAESTDLHVAGEADAEQLSAALGPPPGLLGPKTRVVAGLERQIERLSYSRCRR